ncbi:hypothetical protein OGATHE_004133 [Ogataea polymorpha]|uniref:Uncharacterized protein n=1 Tax=Ogataea polymorpha TaxID=460523 RepID=A0A9P8P4X1_9ASCO|nr:hypothetical protein OGATHE_004133 [Ogataea polymorpha]
MLRQSPPSFDQQACSAVCFDALHVRKQSLAEFALLAVGRVENVVSNGHDGHHTTEGSRRQMHRSEREISCLQGVSEWNPTQIAKCEHETESVGGNVHHGKHAFLVEHSVENVEGLHRNDEQERVSHRSSFQILFLDA